MLTKYTKIFNSFPASDFEKKLSATVSISDNFFINFHSPQKSLLYEYLNMQ